MSLPINPPVGPYVDASALTFDGDGLATHHGFWFWTYPGRSWAVGPFRTRRQARTGRDRYLRMTDGREIRTWHV